VTKKGRRRKQPNLPEGTLRTVRSGRSKRSSHSRAGMSDFNPDYSYVIKDLRRIAILAGMFIALLIVLSFFLA
jgi:hypothetical protein